MTSCFYIMQRMDETQRRCICFVQFARWRHQSNIRQHCLVEIARWRHPRAKSASLTACCCYFVVFSGLVSAEDIDDGIIQRGSVKQASVSSTMAFSRLSVFWSCNSPASAVTDHAHRRLPRTEHCDWSVGSLCCEHDVGFCRSLF